jgi:hypothetical protein
VLFNKDNNAVDVDESSSSLLFCSFVLFNLAYFSGREEKKEYNMRSTEGIEQYSTVTMISNLLESLFLFYPISEEKM